jgi:hypothetical protein
MATRGNASKIPRNYLPPRPQRRPSRPSRIRNESRLFCVFQSGIQFKSWRQSPQAASCPFRRRADAQREKEGP